MENGQPLLPEYEIEFLLNGDTVIVLAYTQNNFSFRLLWLFQLKTNVEGEKVTFNSGPVKA